MYTVYIHQNKESGKRYVGITSTTPERRWKNGYGYSDKLPIGRAFRKYGWNGFTHEIIFENLTEEDAKRIEIELIAAYNTTDPEFGYNICTGGEGVSGWHPSEETRWKISESAKKRTGERNPNFGKKWTYEMRQSASAAHRRENLSEDTLRKMSESAKGRYGEKNSFFGKHHSDETKAVLSGLRQRKVNMYSKDMCYIRSFDSIKEASRIMNITDVGISNCCRGITRTSGGYVWRYADKNGKP